MNICDSPLGVGTRISPEPEILMFIKGGRIPLPDSLWATFSSWVSASFSVT